MSFVNSKLIISGSSIEILNFGRSVYQGENEFRPKGKGRKREVYVPDDIKAEMELEKKAESQKKSFYHSRSAIRRTINANAWQWHNSSNQPFLPVFLTLTFHEMPQSFEWANREFSKFIQRFNYYLKTSFGIEDEKYLAYIKVVEFQKRGAVHYHIIFFNLPYIPKIYDVINELWRFGFNIVKGVDKIDNLGAYLTAYLSKDFSDNQLANKKRFSVSKGLKKSIGSYDENIIYSLLANLPEKLKKTDKEFEDKFVIKLRYRQYNIWPYKSIFDFPISQPNDNLLYWLNNQKSQNL